MICIYGKLHVNDHMVTLSVFLLKLNSPENADHIDLPLLHKPATCVENTSDLEVGEGVCEGTEDSVGGGINEHFPKKEKGDSGMVNFFFSR